MNAPRGNPKWRATAPKLWRIRAKAHDGLVVTLGKYETESEAQLDLQRLADAGGYRNLLVEALPPPPPLPPDSTTQPLPGQSPAGRLSAPPAAVRKAAGPGRRPPRRPGKKER